MPLLMKISESKIGADILDSCVLLRHNSFRIIKENKVSN